MSFIEAINSTLIKNYATFKGRACRAEWWYFVLFSILVELLLVLILCIANYSILPEFFEQYMAYQAADAENGTTFSIQYFIESELGKKLMIGELILALALFLPGFAVTVRRVQDLDASYYWALPYLIVMLIDLWVEIFPAQALEPFILRMAGLIFLVSIIYMLAFIRRGSFDDNRFGPDPLEIEEDTY